MKRSLSCKKNTNENKACFCFLLTRKFFYSTRTHLKGMIIVGRFQKLARFENYRTNHKILINFFTFSCLPEKIVYLKCKKVSLVSLLDLLLLVWKEMLPIHELSHLNNISLWGQYINTNNYLLLMYESKKY